MKITEARLKRIIREEYLRVTPVKPGQLMSEARARHLASEVMQEGLFGTLKAFMKGGASVAGKAAGAAGEAAKGAAGAVAGAAKGAGKAVAGAAKGAAGAVAGAGKAAAGLAADAVKSAVGPVVNAGKEAKRALNSIKNDAVKTYSVAAYESIRDTITKEVESAMADMIKNLVRAGFTEEEAKLEASAVISTALSAASGEAISSE